MALYRCGACGSPNVVTDTQTEGVKYDYVKGAIGTVVLGAGGAVAGVKNNSKQVFKCPDCGLTLSIPMPEEMKIIIDVCVRSASARENINFMGVPMTWDFIKQKFKNIESGQGDVEEQEENARKAKALENLEILAKEILAMADNVKEPLEEESVVKEQQKAWEMLNKDISEAREAAVAAAKADNAARAAKADKDFEEDIRSRVEKVEELRKQQENLSMQKGGLGFFSFGAKKELQSQIDEVGAQIQLQTQKISEMQALAEKPGDTVRKSLDADIQKAAEAYAVSTSPVESYQRKCNWNQKADEYSKGGLMSKRNKFYCMLIVKYLGVVSQDECAALLTTMEHDEVSPMRAESALYGLMKEGLLARDSKRNYYMNK